MTRPEHSEAEPSDLSLGPCPERSDAALGTTKLRRPSVSRGHLLAIALVLTGSSAEANDLADKAACANLAVVRESSAACRRLIDSGRFEARELSEILANLGLGLLQTDQASDAVRVLSDAISANPRNDLAYLGRALGYRNLRQYDQVVRDSTKALELTSHPQLMLQAHQNRARAYASLDDHASAMPDLDRVIQFQPENARNLEVRAQSLNALERHTEALSDLEKALRLDPSSLSARLERAAAFTGLGRVPEALADCDYILEREPALHGVRQRRLVLTVQLVDMTGDRSRADVAIMDAERLLQQIPAIKELGVRAFYAKALLARDRPTEALAQADLELRSLPQSGAAWEARGLALEALARRDEAITAYRQALQPAPGSPLASERLKRLEAPRP